VVAVEVIVNGSTIDVTWSGDDPSAGSGQAGCGVSHYGVDVKVDDEPWTAWLVETTDTSDTYEGEPGHRYAFRVTATDNVGNVGEGEADTRVAAITKYYYWLFGISRGKATYGGTPIRRIGDSPQGQGKGVGIEL
jgi:hypothetical protein